MSLLIILNFIVMKLSTDVIPILAKMVGLATKTVQRCVYVSLEPLEHTVNIVSDG